MTESQEKAPDRIYVTKSIDEFLNKVDASNYFNLSLKIANTTRSELYNFAIALGVETGHPKELNNTVGLTLSKSIQMDTKALMYAVYIDSLSDDNKLDDIANARNVYTMSDEYANTGFEILEDYYKTVKEDVLIWKLLTELDSQYKKCFETT